MIIESGNQIIERYEEHSAPTGEGTKYVTADGQTWHETQPFERSEAFIDREQGRIIPRW